MRWTNSGLTTESAPRTAAGWEVFFPARLLFWHVGLRPAASTVPDSRSEVRARDPSPSRAFSTGASPGPALARPGGPCPLSRAAPLLPSRPATAGDAPRRQSGYGVERCGYCSHGGCCGTRRRTRRQTSCCRSRASWSCGSWTARSRGASRWEPTRASGCGPRVDA